MIDNQRTHGERVHGRLHNEELLTFVRLKTEIQFSLILENISVKPLTVVNDV